MQEQKRGVRLGFFRGLGHKKDGFQPSWGGVFPQVEETRSSASNSFKPHVVIDRKPACGAIELPSYRTHASESHIASTWESFMPRAYHLLLLRQVSAALSFGLLDLFITASGCVRICNATVFTLSWCLLHAMIALLSEVIMPCAIRLTCLLNLGQAVRTRTRCSRRHGTLSKPLNQSASLSPPRCISALADTAG